MQRLPIKDTPVEYEMVIGLEIHAQLSTETKLFCGCRARFGDPANSNACPVCMGLPGALPVLNRRAVDMAIQMGCAIGCTIANESVFARKHYFYPDLPKAFQISQYDRPVCSNGMLAICVDGVEKEIGVTRIHIEEDAGKLIHDRAPESLFDANRCGTPLIEIVSEPDMRTPAQAYAYLTGIKEILEYLGICDCNMEEGSLRCDANISLRVKGDKKLGTKTEIKNMNSFHGVQKALEYEALRQEEVLRAGGKILQDTFLWDPATNRSVSMRSKEDAHDYRYFPEPDLIKLVVTTSRIEELRAALPELPEQRRRRFMDLFGLSQDAAGVLTSTRALADYFEAVVATYGDARQAANWIMVDVLRIINGLKGDMSLLRVTPPRLASLLELIDNGTVSAKNGRAVINKIQESDEEPLEIIRREGMEQVSDVAVLEGIVRSVIESNPTEAQRLRSGDAKLTGFFIGQALRASGGSGNPKEIANLLRKLLG